MAAGISSPGGGGGGASSSSSSSSSGAASAGARVIHLHGGASLTLSELKRHIASLHTSRQSFVHRLAVVLRRIMEHKCNRNIFNVPVRGIKEYGDVVKQPMDLGMVKERLEAGFYAEPDEFARDVNLVFDNALTFNPGGHPVHTLAGTLKMVFQSEYDRVVELFIDSLRFFTFQVVCGLTNRRTPRYRIVL